MTKLKIVIELNKEVIKNYILTGIFGIGVIIQPISKILGFILIFLSLFLILFVKEVDE